MRRTLITLAAFLACAAGVGIAADDLMPAPATPAAHVVLDTSDDLEPTGTMHSAVVVVPQLGEVAP